MSRRSRYIAAGMAFTMAAGVLAQYEQFGLAAWSCVAAAAAIHYVFLS